MIVAVIVIEAAVVVSMIAHQDDHSDNRVVAAIRVDIDVAVVLKPMMHCRLTDRQQGVRWMVLYRESYCRVASACV